MWDIFFGLLIIVGVIIFIVMLWFFIFFLIVGKKYKYKLPVRRAFKERSKLLQLLIDLPLQYWRDRFEFEEDTFDMKGFHMICGEQGSGKTIFAVWFLQKLKEQYPKVKIKSNCFYKYQDEELKSAYDIIYSSNGVFGEIDFVDEIQNWFNSMQSKDFPIEMIQEITQQRKQHKVLLGTSQVFTRVAKPLREQVNYLYLPVTLLGCLTIVRVVKPKLDTEGNLKESIPIKWYMFVHSPKVRDSYDTYHKIEFMARGGLAQKDWSKMDSIAKAVR